MTMFHQAIGPDAPDTGTILDLLRWTGTAAGIAGAVLLALNIPLSRWGWILFLVNSVCWTAAGLWMDEPSIWALFGTFTVVNLLGIWRWLR